MMIFDTHAHYDDEQFNPDREELLSSMEAGGVGTIMNVSASFDCAWPGPSISVCVCSDRCTS